MTTVVTSLMIICVVTSQPRIYDIVGDKYRDGDSGKSMTISTDVYLGGGK